MRLRLLAGLAFLLGGLSVYAVLAVAAAAALFPMHWAVELLFYAVVGTAWIFPAARITRWMQDIGPWRGHGPE